MTSASGPSRSPLRFGFRRRCAWCGVVLRGWQANRCRMCHRAGVEMAGRLTSPPCRSASRWDDEPDTWRATTNAEEASP